MAEQNRTKVLKTLPTGEFTGTIVNNSFILDEKSKERLEQQNVKRCQAYAQESKHLKENEHE